MSNDLFVWEVFSTSGLLVYLSCLLFGGEEGGRGMWQIGLCYLCLMNIDTWRQSIFSRCRLSLSVSVCVFVCLSIRLSVCLSLSICPPFFSSLPLSFPASLFRFPLFPPTPLLSSYLFPFYISPCLSLFSAISFLPICFPLSLSPSLPSFIIHTLCSYVFSLLFSLFYPLSHISRR